MKTFEGQVTIKFKLTQEDVDDILTTAFEGGINYWCNEAEVVDEYLGEYASEQISRGGKIKLYDDEGDDVYELDIEKFMQGFMLWIECGYDEYGAIKSDGSVDCCEIDAEMADMIIQLALFGEIVYG